MASLGPMWHSAGFRPQHSGATPAAKTLVQPCLGPKSTISESTPRRAQQGYIGSGGPHSWMDTSVVSQK